MRNQFMQNKIFLTFTFVFLLCYTGFIFFMYTPWYTATQLKFAYKNHNIVMLTNSVNIDSVVSSGYDDLTGDLFTYNSNIPPKVKQIFNQFYQLIKTPVCSGTLKIIDDYLKNNVWNDPTGTSVLKGRELGIDYDELVERSMLRNTAIHSFGKLTKNENGDFILPLTVADRYTDTDFTLELLLQKTASGTWQVTKIINYHEYLLHVRDLCDNDIVAYVKDTKDKTAEYNRAFQSLQTQFQNLTKNINSSISKTQRQQIQYFIVNKIIPTYKTHEAYLQDVDVPSGALHLHILRLQSNAKTIQAWQYFAQGIADDSPAMLAKAEKNHQEALTLEQKVSDIINKMPALFVPEIP
ncbi:hypothetical protein [Pectinatus frisingensis]|uniref:hypothetical protein n=1 Tax=Pectinatus frisingensis TaxID=865 RepID=UPI003D806FDA